VFLINASLGLYAESIADREQRFKIFGRNRLGAIVSTIISFFTHRILLRVDIEKDGTASSIRTPNIFIGNNALQLRNLKLDVAQCMKQDLLALVLMKPFTKLEIFRVILRGLTKTLDSEESLVTFCIDHFRIHTRKPVQRVALDGELLWTRSPLEIKALPDTLNMVLPPKELAP
jgi:diacylglycerol kinase family enzyme